MIETVLVDIAEGVAEITLNRPERVNAIDRATAIRLQEICRELEADSSLQAVVIAGAGEKGFCSGIDLKERSELTPDEQALQSRELSRAIECIETLPVPVIARLHGYVLGGGLEIALGCDIRIASSDSWFGFPEIELGAFPGSGGVVRLASSVGVTRAKDLLFSGRRFNAEEALRYGVVHSIVPNSELEAATREYVARIVSHNRQAMVAMKQILNIYHDTSLHAAQIFASVLRSPLNASPEYQARVRTVSKERRR